MKHFFIIFFTVLIACSIEHSCEDCLENPPPKEYFVTYDFWVFDNDKINVIAPEIKTPTDTAFWVFTAINKVEPDSIYHYEETIDVTYLMELLGKGDSAFFRYVIVYPDLSKQVSANIDTLIK